MAKYLRRFPSILRKLPDGREELRVDYQGARASEVAYQQYIINAKRHAIGTVGNTTEATSDTRYVLRTYEYKVRLTPPSTFLASSNISGFSGAITPTLSGDIITLTSADSEFDDGFRLEDSTSLAQKYTMSASEFKIQLPPNWDTGFSFVELIIYKEQF